MTAEIFDSHAHYDDKQFDNDRSETIKSQFENGICCIINCGSNIESSEFSISLAENYEKIYAAVGIHPQDVDGIDPDKAIAEIKRLAAHKKVVAIGEIGLDYHYLPFDRNLQIKAFELQLQLANELSLPVIVHDREAHEDIYRSLKKYRPKGVVHCFSGSEELMREAIKLGLYIGIGGSVTFKNAKHPVNVAREVPADRLLLETDCPYMSPVPHRGKRNMSVYIRQTAEKIAEIRDSSANEIISAATENAKKLFNIQ